MKTEFYEPGDQLRKVSMADREQITQESSGWIARKINIRDLRDETHTDLVIEKLEVDEKISKKMFSLRELERGGR